MTFIVTVLSEGYCSDGEIDAPPLIIEEVPSGADARFRAGFIPGLTRYLGVAPKGRPFYILLADKDGWKSSDSFFEVPSDDDVPAFLQVPDELREVFGGLLENLLKRSPAGRVILILEYNGSVTAPDTDETTAESVDIVGPVSLSRFWQLHDLREILEESIVTIGVD